MLQLREEYKVVECPDCARIMWGNNIPHNKYLTLTDIHANFTLYKLFCLIEVLRTLPNLHAVKLNESDTFVWRSVSVTMYRPPRRRLVRVTEAAEPLTDPASPARSVLQSSLTGLFSPKKAFLSAQTTLSCPEEATTQAILRSGTENNPRVISSSISRINEIAFIRMRFQTAKSYIIESKCCSAPI